VLGELGTGRMALERLFGRGPCRCWCRLEPHRAGPGADPAGDRLCRATRPFGARRAHASREGPLESTPRRFDRLEGGRGFVGEAARSVRLLPLWPCAHIWPSPWAFSVTILRWTAGRGIS
jgi:hypothetical protein